MLRYFNKTPNSIIIILKVYVLSLLIFFVFRISQFIIHFKELFNDQFNSYEIFNSFIFGFKYDLVITSYLILLPYIFLIIYDYLNIEFFKKIAFELSYILFSISILFSIVDIPYYNKFYHRLTYESFAWFNDASTVFGMIFQEPIFIMLTIVLLISLIFYRKLLQKIYTNNKKQSSKSHYLVVFILVFFSLRGSFYGAPLRHRDAFDGDNPFLNSLKLNPVYTIEKSYEEYLKTKNSKLTLIDDDTAIANMREYLNINQTNLKSPIARNIKFDSLSKNKKNVVLILMEGMATAKLKYFGNTENRTPFLDSLFLKGIGFTNLYSNGIHTYGGVFGTNYSFPLIFGKHPMTTVITKNYNGLPYTLKKNGYDTSFFIAGHGAFDNMSYFLSNNHYDNVYTKSNYPKDKIANIYGVSDDFLLEFALKKISEQHKNSNKPFLATVLTVSDHIPYKTPKYYKSKSDNANVNITQFADWSLSKFMQKAKKEAWFDNTIFIFIADHGQAFERNYKTSLTYNHTPLIFYYKDIKPQIITKMASQLDVFPSLMNLLQINYTNNSFGIDLFRETRPYTLFNQDKDYGVINEEFLLIANRHETFGLYKYTTNDKKNYANEYPIIRKAMETYYKSHIQSCNYLLNRDLQFIE